MKQYNPLRSADMRIHNQNIILSRIYEARERGISQSELVQETGLKAPTIFRIFSSLEEQGLIEIFNDSGDHDTEVRKGRRPVAYTVIKDALYTIGLEFWASSISLGVFNFNGTRIFSRIEPLKGDIDSAGITRLIVRLVNDALASLKISREKVPGIGVAASGQVDVNQRSVIFYPRIRGMKEVFLAEALEKELGISVLLHNNCSAIALSEYRYGNYDHRGSMFTFLLRAGVNGAFVDEKGIYITSQGTTLETGHVPIDSRGPQCSCGTHGCLEAYLRELDKKNVEQGLPLFSGFDERLAAGDRDAKKTMTAAADCLFVSMKSIMRFLTPRSFLIIGNGELISGHIATALRKRWASEPDAFVPDPPQVFSHAYDPLVSQRGASDLVISYYFS
ncbi:ROK family transcriptional regulator [Breznakiella homolactica]|uniref:ROK family protein n=1 Tax=Breznakiella homolactica TaxID=2798577 RepID=A0A7T8BBS5_9SPIR|nr:ROK family protein [Breznakiella homolactica]QQO09513.1 ROK family protein [Breznakiella homolactica]